MPIDQERPNVELEIANEAKHMLQEKLVSSGIAGLLSLVPGVGAAVSELMTELAIQRTNNRVKEMFEHFTARVHEVGEEKVDREWFRSEEFQTLLYEAFSQLNVTHDREKIEMLGTALGNSGAPGFKEEERKDLFIRFVRDLTRQHVKVLLQLVPNYLPMRASGTVEPLNEETERKLKWGSRPTVNPRADDLLVLQMLHAYGLVEEHINSSIVQPRIPARFTSENQMIGALKKVTKNMEHPTVTRSFRLSPLGNDFLKFMGLPKA